MTCSGGDSAVAADLAAELGVDLPALAPATIARLEAIAARRGDRGQPARLHVAAVGRAGRAARADRGARATTRRSAGCSCCSTRLSTPRTGADPRRGQGRGRRRDRRLDAARAVPATAAIAGLRSGAAGARSALARRARPRADRRDRRGAPRRARRPASRSTRRRRCCATAGIPVVPGWTVTDEDAAVAAWRELGGAGRAQAHRRCATRRATAASVLDVDDEPARHAAAYRRARRHRCSSSGWPRRGTELLVAVRRDGVVPVLVVGAGGVHTELLDDVASSRCPPTRRASAEALRHAPHADRHRTPIARLATQLQTLPLALIELNPVIVHGDQRGGRRRAGHQEA